MHMLSCIFIHPRPRILTQIGAELFRSVGGLNQQALSSLGTFQDGTSSGRQGEIFVIFEPVTTQTSVYLRALLLLTAMKLRRGWIWLRIVSE